MIDIKFDISIKTLNSNLIDKKNIIKTKQCGHGEVKRGRERRGEIHWRK